MRTAIYVRVSQDREGTSTSIADQLRECEAFCASRGWQEPAIFTDHAVSASSAKPRPAFQAMLRRIEEFDALVCWSSDRLMRRPADLELLIDRAERGQLAIHALHSSELVLSSPEGRAVARTLVAWSKAETERLSERIKRKQASLIAEGRHTGGPRPYGYTASGMEVVPEEAAMLREAASALLAGATVKAICRDLAERGILTAQGRQWLPGTLTRTLGSLRVAGLHPVTGKRAAWPAILTRRDSAAVRDLLDDRRQLATPRGANYLLTGGLAVCGLCSAPMIGRPVSKVPRYLCVSSGTLHLSISAARLEQHVLAVADAHPTAPREAAADPALLSAPILAALDAVDDALADWAGRAAVGEISAAEYRGARKALVARQEDLERQLAETVPAPARIWPTPAEYASYGRAGTRLWLETVIARIEVLPAEKAGQFSPGRVRITWRSK